MLGISGGRTSAFMLRQILDAHGGALPEDVIPVFTNTGREFPATLDFVRDIGERWCVPIRWLEYNHDAASGLGFEHVNHATASRDGTPFSRMMDEVKFVPNSARRLCTKHLKILVMHAYARSLGWGTSSEWVNVVGIRADEPWRLAKIKKRIDDGEDIETPLYTAGATEDDVMRFWGGQPFNLALRPGESNCDLCMLKGAALRVRIMQDHPEVAGWWIEQEERRGHTFRKGKQTYRVLSEYARRQLPILFDDDVDDEARNDCACTD